MQHRGEQERYEFRYPGNPEVPRCNDSLPPFDALFPADVPGSRGNPVVIDDTESSESDTESEHSIEAIEVDDEAREDVLSVNSIATPQIYPPIPSKYFDYVVLVFCFYVNTSLYVYRRHRLERP